MTNNAKQVFHKFLSEFDLYPASINLRKQGDHDLKSCCIGSTILILGILFLSITVSNMRQILNLQKIQSTLSLSSIGKCQANGTISMFGVTLDFLTFKEFGRMFQFRLYYEKSGSLYQTIEMQPCRLEQWSLLQQNQPDFKQQDINYLYCPKIDQPNYFQLLQTLRSDSLDYIYLTLTACDTLTNSNCNTSLINQYLSNRSENGGSAQIWIYILDKEINPYQKQPVSYRLNTDAKVQITQILGGAAGIQLETFIIETDTSFLPFENIEKNIGSKISAVRNYPIVYKNITNDRLAIISFSMGTNLKIVKRKLGKIDQALSYAGGLFSMVVAILCFFFSSFNKYRYEVQILNQLNQADSNSNQKNQKNSNNLDNPDHDNNKIQDINFLTYIKYTIFDWIKLLFCRQLNWQTCKKIQKMRAQAQNKLDVIRIIKSLQKFQQNQKAKSDSCDRQALLLSCRTVCFVLNNLGKDRNQRCKFSEDDVMAYFKQATNGGQPQFIANLLKIQKQYHLYQTANRTAKKESNRVTNAHKPQPQNQQQSKAQLSIDPVSLKPHSIPDQQISRPPTTTFITAYQKITQLIAQNPQIRAQALTVTLSDKSRQLQSQLAELLLLNNDQKTNANANTDQTKLFLCQLLPIGVVWRLRQIFDGFGDKKFMKNGQQQAQPVVGGNGGGCGASVPALRSESLLINLDLQFNNQDQDKNPNTLNKNINIHNNSRSNAQNTQFQQNIQQSLKH